MSLLRDLPSIVTSSAKRVGRGYGSQRGGHTSGRGMKGQLSRTGAPKSALWFEGGQLPLIKRLPMLRGKSRFVSLKTKQEVQLRDVLAKGLTEITPETLLEAKLIRSSNGIPRIIGATKVETAVTVSGVETSNSVQKAIESAGGKVTQ